MKRFHRLIGLLAALSIISSTGTVAYATETTPEQSTEPPTIEQPAPEEALPTEPPAEEIAPEQAIVYSVEELQAAISAAAAGDTIVLGCQISIDENCTIGHPENTITLVPADTFTSGAFFMLSRYPDQNIIFQNLILDGNSSSLSAIIANELSNSEIRGEMTVSNVQVKNFLNTFQVVSLYAITASFDNCHFSNNTARRTAGIECAENTSVKIENCSFNNNQSSGNGGAIRSRGGHIAIRNTEIIDNLVADDSARAGGGISLEYGASCEITSCKIINNTADVGGGIMVDGTLEISDTLIYGNTGLKGASDIYSFVGSKILVSYSVGLDAIYTENDPIGFYADYFEAPFDPTTNAVFLGEVLNIESTKSRFGAKFIFSNDLPVPQPPETDTPPVTEPEEPQPTPPIDPDPEPAPEPIPDPQPDYKPRPPKPHREPKPEPIEMPKQTLSCGGLTVDTEKSLALAGYGNGDVGEYDPITRAQISVLLYRSITSDSMVANRGVAFFDVPTDAWYGAAVDALASAGVVVGCNGLFCPNDNLTWAQLVTLLTRFVEPKTTDISDNALDGHWAYNYIVTAYAYGWIDDISSFNPDKPVMRGEAVEFINSIFEKCNG